MVCVSAACSRSAAVRRGHETDMAKWRHIVRTSIILSCKFTELCDPSCCFGCSVNAGFKGPGGPSGSGKCWQETPCAERPGGPFNTTHPYVHSNHFMNATSHCTSIGTTPLRQFRSCCVSLIWAGRWRRLLSIGIVGLGTGGQSRAAHRAHPFCLSGASRSITSGDTFVTDKIMEYGSTFLISATST
jgi:hypothetical protein